MVVVVVVVVVMPFLCLGIDGCRRNDFVFRHGTDRHEMNGRKETLRMELLFRDGIRKEGEQECERE
jgi:hypothetical protein